MTSPVFPTLGATTVVRKWILEVNTGSTISPNWKMIGGVNANQFNPDAAHFEDDSDMQSGGAGSQTKTAGDSSITITALRKVKADGVSYDDAQEFIRLKAINKYGPDNSVQMRIYEFTPSGGPRVEAYVGNFAPGWAPAGGGNTALDAVQISFMGQGACVAVTHPYPAVPTIPVVTAVAPNGGLLRAGGDMVNIQGTGFSTTVPTSGVKFGTVNAPKWIVESDTLIVATTPAQTAAGAVQVVVTNAAGASTSAVNATYL